MAVRYSGDVEIRIVVVKSGLRVSIRAPGVHGSRTFTRKELLVPSGAMTSERYDRVAERVLTASAKAYHLRVERSGGRVVVDRVFKAPCPVFR